MQPMARPWLSPKVVTTNSVPKLLPDTLQIPGRQQKHALSAMLEREPYKCNIRVGFFERRLAVTDFADEYAVVGQEPRCIMQDQFRRIQTVGF